MAITSDLVFLGPAIGAVITSLYTVRTVRHSSAVSVHTSYVERRLDVLTAFLESLERCQDDVPPPDPQTAAKSVYASLRRVRLTFPTSSKVNQTARTAARCAVELASNPQPEPLKVVEILNALQAQASYEEGASPEGYVSPASRILDLLRDVYAEQREAAAQGKDDPAEQYEDVLWRFESETAVNLSGALPSTRMRERHKQACAAHEEAAAEFTQALDAFVDAAARWTDAPLQSHTRAPEREGATVQERGSRLGALLTRKADTHRLPPPPMVRP